MIQSKKQKDNSLIIENWCRKANLQAIFPADIVKLLNSFALTLLHFNKNYCSDLITVSEDGREITQNTEIETSMNGRVAVSYDPIPIKYIKN